MAPFQPTLCPASPQGPLRPPPGRGTCPTLVEAAYRAGLDAGHEPLSIAKLVVRFVEALPRRSDEYERETLAASFRRGAEAARGREGAVA